ncbi:hypothetical protein BKA64DRAFT_684732 [Cadophora sp. MPI-SDFR-AT-0126]|nr:hypothetical protein BKA64DRAFT_684732 [Leotiomycetes sp. MPI-SDFR-AT-0126]
MAAPPVGPVLIAGQVTGPIPIQQAGQLLSYTSQLLFYTAQPHPHARVYWNALPSKPLSSTNTLPPYHTKFHLFSLLPIELRLRIWFLLAPPRVLELRSWGDITNHFTPIKISIAPHTPPILLRINHESRTEALRIYSTIKLGISVSTILQNRRYIPWSHHPNNPNHLLDRLASRYNQEDITAPLAWPYRPRTIHVNWNLDTIYLGPEFQLQHLKHFLTSTGSGFELPSLQNLAINAKLLAGTSHGSWEYLREALYALRSRPVREVAIVPDDEKNSLLDRYFYQEHEIELLEPEWTYEFKPEGQTERSKTVVVNLEEWFERLWTYRSRDVGDGRDTGSKRSVPRVCLRSVRRAGKRMGDFREGAWEVQKTMGDMRIWQTWVPGSG